MKAAIRKAERGDIEAIVSLHDGLAEYHLPIDKYYRADSETKLIFRRHLSGILNKRSSKVLIAEYKGIAIAYIIGSIEKPKPYASVKKIGRISDAFVLPEYRKQGIGRGMLREMVGWFRQNRIKYIELSVDSRNRAGIKAWERLGFREFMKKMRLDF